MARKFFNEFERGFEQDSPYREDIKRLGCIMNRDQLEQNDIISTFKVRDTKIRRDLFLRLKGLRL